MKNNSESNYKFVSKNNNVKIFKRNDFLKAFRKIEQKNNKEYTDFEASFDEQLNKIEMFCLLHLVGLRCNEILSQRNSDFYIEYEYLINYLFKTKINTNRAMCTTDYRSMQVNLYCVKMIMSNDKNLEIKVKNIILAIKSEKFNEYHKEMFTIACDRSIELAQLSKNTNLITWLFSNYNIRGLNKINVLHLCDILDTKYHYLLKKYLLNQIVVDE